MFDVITIGSATVDVFAKTESELIKFKTTHGEDAFIAYPSGSKILITDLKFMIGGGGTNTAVCFSRLGLKTGYLGKLGDDYHADMVLKTLKDEKIEFLGSRGKETGYSIILDSIEDDRTILTYKGSNDCMREKDVKLSKINSKWIYISSMLRESYETTVKISEHAKKKRIRIAFNCSSYQAKKGLEYLSPILRNVDVLILNKEEAKYITGPLIMDNLLKELFKTGPRIVAITDGKKGVYAYDGEFFYHSNPLPKRKIVETTGAGDAFASTFVAGIIRGKKIEDCIRMGMINAESVIANYGAKNILMSRTKLVSLMKTDKRQVFKHKI